MKAIRVLQRRPQSVVGGGGLTLSRAPSVSGIPREGEYYWVDPGDYTGGTATNFRYKKYRNGSLVSTVTQSGPLQGLWLGADVDLSWGFTIEAFDGASWMSPVAANDDCSIKSDVIMPATIADGSIALTSTAMTFDVTATPYPSYRKQIRIFDGATLATELYVGEQSVSETELHAPYNFDLSGATDPIPNPTLPTGLADTVVFKMRYCSQDFIDGKLGLGVAGNWMGVCATARSGHRFWKLHVPDDGQSILYLRSIEFALAASGTDLANWNMGCNYSGSQALGDPDNNGMINLFDASSNPAVLFLPFDVIIDFTVPVPLAAMRITSHQTGKEPVNMTLSYADTFGGTYTAVTPSPSMTSLTWAAAPATKEWTF